MYYFVDEIVSDTPQTLEMTGFDKEDAHLTNQQRAKIVVEVRVSSLQHS